MRVLRSAVASKDARTPGYMAAVEAAATGGDETHYEVPADQYRQIVVQFGGKVVRAQPRRHRFALGDAVEKTLSAVGVTKELVQKITRKPCGCPARQRWLNQWGYRQQERIEKAVNKAAKWYGIGG